MFDAMHHNAHEESDVYDGNDGQQLPNAAMSMAREMDAVVERLDRLHKTTHREVPIAKNLAAAAPDLLAELQYAHRLLAIALGCMTPAGQAKFANRSEIAGIGTDGATRHHERAAAIAKAVGSAS